MTPSSIDPFSPIRPAPTFESSRFVLLQNKTRLKVLVSFYLTLTPLNLLVPGPDEHFCLCLLTIQDMQVTGVEDDSRALNITIHKPASSPHSKPFPILQATFVFSDHIRCIIAKQRLAKGRIQARRMKMQRIAGK